MEKVSIDFAVMEHAPEVLVVQAPYRWDDVGSWLALERMNPQDADGNTVLGEFCGVNTKGCVIVGDAGRMIGDDRRGESAYHSGRRRNSCGRPPRGRHRQKVGGTIATKEIGKVPVTSAGRLLGVDFGDVRVGLAISDPDRKIAFPLATYMRREPGARRRLFSRRD